MKTFNLKTLLVLLTFFSFSKMNSQVIYNKDAWAFELDKGVRNSKGNTDIVTAWTQEPGFTLSSEHAHSGNYSCKMDFSKQPKSGKLQTWRSKNGKEGDFRVLSEQSYSVSAWFYIPSGTPTGRFSITIEKRDHKKVVASLDLRDVNVGKWTKVTAEFNGIPSVTRGLWSSVNYYMPNSDSDLTIYVDDITFYKTNKFDFN